MNLEPNVAVRRRWTPHRAVVTGVFASRIDLGDAVELLKDAGFRAEEMDVVLRDRETHEAVSAAAKRDGVATGMTAGAVLGGTFGWLVGIGTLIVPGVGPIIASGPLLTALAGVGLGGAFGGMAGAITALGVPDARARRYAERVEAGHAFLTVRCRDYQKLTAARDVFVACGGRELAGALGPAVEESPPPHH